MGIDAPSSDLTARIQATRKRLILSGDIEPMKPGERLIHGRQPGAAAILDVDAVSRAADLRARRAGTADTVVEMDMTDYTGTQPGTKELLEAADADEPFALGEETPEAEVAPEQEDVFNLGGESEPSRPTEPELEVEPERIQAVVHREETFADQFEQVREQLAGIEAALVLIAREFSARLDEILETVKARETIVLPPPPVLSDEEAEKLREEFRAPILPTPVAHVIRSRWRTVLSLILGPDYWPYE